MLTHNPALLVADTPSSTAAAAAAAVAAADAAEATSADGATKKVDPKKQAKLDKFAAKQAKLAEKATADKAKKDTETADSAPAAKKKSTKGNDDELLNDTTVKGEKKDLSKPMPSSYHPKYVESSWYEWWEKSGFFKPECSPKFHAPERPDDLFVMAIPPPNVTGSLHLGHALMLSVEDALTRYSRMRGRVTLWNPGCDHAGIATQVVVEKKIMAERKVTRHELGREKFVETVWEWKNKYGDRIYSQLRKMGASVDWDRSAFTMDEKLSRAVTEAFVRLHESNTVYRTTRLVNWCSKLKTAISNLEVDKKELTGRTMLAVSSHNNRQYEFGVLIFFAYKIENSNDEIVVATTRIETMLGDTAIAVNPSDERYKHLVGKHVTHPFVERRIPIIADSYVDKDFGSGAVKITPAHDPNDYAIGQRHGLPFINILTDEGAINQNGGRFSTMMRFDARVAVLATLEELKLVRDKKDNPMSVPVCSRSGDIIEPYIKPQWYVRTTEMAKAAAEAVTNKEIEIIPDQFDKTWFSWLNDPQDWCISRQLWWGHRIPVYLAYPKGQPKPDEANERFWVSGRTEAEARRKAVATLYPNEDPDNLIMTQDEDVLDTWFSSGLFPFAIFGWPENTVDLQMFYPNTILETGHDILFFWVARMVMLGITLTGQVPFKKIFLHAMVRDAHGRKMSKSLGNVIDPLDMISGISLKDLQQQIDESTNLDPREKEKAKHGQKQDFPDGIGECGTDALRFALCAYTVQAQNINLDVKRVEAYRNFCNKIWNAVRFCFLNWGEGYQPTDISGLHANTLVEHWVLTRLNTAIKEANAGFNNYSLPQATTACYNFWLYELCDVFLEALKPVMMADETVAGAVERKKHARDVLYTCVDMGLRLLHPFMPFVTEELWQRLPRRPSDKTPSLCVAEYPQPMDGWTNDAAAAQFEDVNATIKVIRSLRSAHLQPKQEAVVLLVSKDEALLTLLLSQTETISSLCRLKELKKLGQGEAIPNNMTSAPLNDKLEVHLMLQQDALA